MKQETNYTFTVRDGRATLALKTCPRSANCEYPLVLSVLNEETQKYELKRQSRKQTIAYLLKVLAEN